MADFLTDYSGLGAAAGALKGFGEAVNEGEDRKMKKMELDAHLKAQEDQKQRQALLDKLALQKEGYSQGTDGSLQEAALTPRQVAANKLKEFSEGAKASGYDEQGNPTGYQYDPNTMKAKEAEAKAMTARAAMGTRNDRLEETKDQHGIQAGKVFEDDPMLKTMKNTRLNLDRARNIMTGKTPVTSQNFAMLQQDLIQATAPGGAATEGKVNREMLDTFAQKLNEVQSRFGNVKDLRKEQPEIFAQLKGMMDQIDDEYKQGMASRATDLAGSYAHSSNNKVRATVDDKLKRYTSGADGQGLLGQPQGLLGSKPGLLGAGSQPTAQDPDAVKYAQQYGLDYDHAKAILDKRRGGQ